MPLLALARPTAALCVRFCDVLAMSVWVGGAGVGLGVSVCVGGLSVGLGVCG